MQERVIDVTEIVTERWEIESRKQIAERPGRHEGRGRRESGVRDREMQRERREEDKKMTKPSSIQMKPSVVEERSGGKG